MQIDAIVLFNKILLCPGRVTQKNEL